MRRSVLLLLSAFLLFLPMGAQSVQKLMGHYDGDSISSKGYSMPNSGSISLAIMLDPEELEIYQGGKVVAVRIGLVNPAEISRVFFIPVLANGKYGTRTDFTCEMGDAGWNTLELSAPYDINLAPDEKLLVGFYYKQVAGEYPISLVKQGLPYDCYTYKKVGSQTKWKEVGFTDYGNLSIQCVVEKESYPDYRIKCYDFRAAQHVVSGEMLPFAMSLQNRGMKQIGAGDLAVDVQIDGKHVETITNESPFVDGLCSFYGEVPTEGIAAGKHTLLVRPVSVADVPLEDIEPFEQDFVIFKQVFPRQKHLVEQLTSTYCKYCPLGNAVLSLLTQQRDDVVWVGIHGNLGSGVDPFRSNQGDSLMVYMTGGSVSYPSGAFDRTVGWSDDTNIVGGLGFNSSYRQEAADYFDYYFDYVSENNPTFAEVEGDCSFNESSRVANISIHGRISTDFDTMVGEDAKLNVYIVEDGLVAKQLNDGNWISNYVHNGVFRMALGSVLGVDLNRYCNRYLNNFRVTIPENWKWSNLRVVAFISRPLKNSVNGFTDLMVNNANDFKFSESNGIEDIVLDQDAVPVEYYDITGRRYDSLQPGLNIVKMSDGSSRKVLVK